MAVSEMFLSVTFKNSTTFNSTAIGITDGNYHSVCVTWKSEGGIVDLYFDGG